jgi:hypothetical protein
LVFPFETFRRPKGKKVYTGWGLVPWVIGTPVCFSASAAGAHDDGASDDLWIKSSPIYDIEVFNPRENGSFPDTTNRLRILNLE